MVEPGSELVDVISRAHVLLIDFDGAIWTASGGPAVGLAGVVRAADSRGWRIGVVSNGDADAIDTHVRADDDLKQCVSGLAARVDSLDPGLLMPDPFLVRAGLTAASHQTGVPPTDAVLVSATEHGIQAASAAGVSAIGYAPGHAAGERLIEAGADAITETLDELADAFARTSKPG
jgi:phosphoglycolate phosphatase-like HAD superfamily hydrolase